MHLTGIPLRSIPASDPKRSTKGDGIVLIVIYVSTIIVAWLGLRHLISIIIGQSHGGALKPGQRLCHFTSLVLLWGGCGAALYLHHFWPLVVAIVVEYGFRKAVIRSGDQMKELDQNPAEEA